MNIVGVQRKESRMTAEEYQKKHDKYIEKSEYYRKKALDLEVKFHEELNKDNKFLRVLAESEDKK